MRNDDYAEKARFATMLEGESCLAFESGVVPPHSPRAAGFSK
jgi:hypothetical protein